MTETFLFLGLLFAALAIGEGARRMLTPEPPEVETGWKVVGVQMVATRRNDRRDGATFLWGIK